MSKDASADSVIRQHVYWSVGAGLVPVPIADFVAVTAVQLDLIRQLCTLYGVSYEEGTGKVWVGALTGGAVARIGASAIKAIPGIGSILGAVSMSIASGASTYAVGQVVKSHLMTGGTMSNLDVEQARAKYDAEYEKGKAVAKEASNDKEAGDVFQKLEKLGKLRDSGVITAAEFEAKKAELLKEV
ncbi:MAG: SHOCT domain-containing protein [Myxococcaceae bacterium]|nr:SHOCT domain-containing protein [Myxococcaceae bacterium]